MKFACERCGKKYATAGDPAPGKVYKLKCKACGHLIVVRGQAGTTTGTAGPAATPPPPLPAPPPPSPATTLQIELPAELPAEPEPRATPSPALPPVVAAPPPAAPPPAPPPVVAAPTPVPSPGAALEVSPPAAAGVPAALPPEVALAVDSAAGPAGPDSPEPPPGPLGLPEAAPSGLDPALTPPPPEKDELADFAAAAAEVMAGVGTPGQAGGSGDVVPFGDGAAGKPATDPFSMAARASLPDTWTGGAPASASPAPRPLSPAPAPARPAPPRSALRGLPIVIIGIGLAALVGIAAFALLGRGGSPPPARPMAVPGAEPGPPSTTPTQPEARPPAPEPATSTPAEPVPEPGPPERKPEPRNRPPERRLEKRAEPKPADRRTEPGRPPPAPDTAESRDADLPEATGLPRDEVNKVVLANRKAFSTCIANAAGSEVKLDGRPVALRITINTNGTVTSPKLDEPALNSTEMGQCLRSAARLMVFPKFKGEPFQHDVVLALSGN